MRQRFIGMRSFTLVIGNPPTGGNADRTDRAGGVVSTFRSASAEATTVRLCAVMDGRQGEHQPGGGDGVVRYLLGDAQDFGTFSDSPYLGNGLTLLWNEADRSVEVIGSITGLPAAFLYRGPDRTVLSSDIRGIAEVPGVALEFDPAGLTELATIGHPINHRTLFRDVSVVPAGARLKLVDGKRLENVESWSTRDARPFADWPSYIDAQSAAMRAAVRRLDLSQSFLSLTAGLDTRAIFALLASEGLRVPAYTMSGERETLDAMRARQLCRAYAMPHQNISIGPDYLSGVAEFASEASRLSGGIGSLTQAFEVYFYRSIAPALRARVSGNLGNQIGRSGTEGTGMRGASLDVLEPAWRSTPPGAGGAHWFEEIFPEQQMLHPLFLIQNENLYASLGNYCVGSHFAVQQTPYADHTVISQKLRQPPLPHPTSGREPIWRIKLRDLKHRVLGQPLEFSFQRYVVRRAGGYAARCPINWGWRARGGLSMGGLFQGARALTDAVVGARFGRRPLMKRVLDSIGVLGFSGFQAVDLLAKPRVAEFVTDTLGSASIRQNGILNPVVLQRLVDDGVANPHHRATIEFAMDVALAQENFVERL